MEFNKGASSLAGRKNSRVSSKENGFLNEHFTAINTVVDQQMAEICSDDDYLSHNNILIKGDRQRPFSAKFQPTDNAVASGIKNSQNPNAKNT